MKNQSKNIIIIFSKIKIPNNLSTKENLIYSLLDNSVKVSHEINANLIILFTDEIKFAKIKRMGECAM